MSRKGNPYDNAMAENFFSILKTECTVSYTHLEKTQNVFIKEALLLKQALSLCSSLVDEQTRMELSLIHIS